MVLFLMLLFVPATAPAAGKVLLRASGGPVGAGKDFRVQMVAEAIRKGNPGWAVDVINGPTAIAEVAMIGQGALQFGALDAAGITQVAKGHYYGTKLPKPVKLRWLLPSTAMTTVFYLLKDVPINSFGELKEKKYPLKFSAIRKGSDPYNITRTVLETYGYSYKDILSWGGKMQNTASRRSADLMADGLMAGFMLSGTYPVSAVAELARKREIKAIFVSEPEIQEKLFRQGFIRIPIKAGSYNFVKNDTTTVAMPALIVVAEDMSDESAYNMTRAVWEQRKDLLYPLHRIFREYLQPEVISEWGAKFRDWIHPGAEKFWKEKGLLK